ncbi:MAG: alginate lyase family protein [Anaerolineae bacterium]|nr:MAG: alginate lyase family protein [Anaerolineae bacterium]
MTLGKQSRFHQLRYLTQRGYLFLSKGPRYVAVFARYQANRWARQMGVLRRPWLIDSTAFWSKFDLNRPELARIAAAARSGKGEDATRVLLDYFRQRKAPRFFFDWNDRSRLLALVSSEAQEATIEAADMVVRRTFYFRGQPPITFDGPIDWHHRPGGNTDWTWDLNRHSYFVALGQAFWYTEDERYLDTFTELLTDWLRQNPADEGQPNWTNPFEVACRISTWSWAYHLFLSAGVLDATAHLELLRGLWTHGAYLDACLELHVPNNHLLLEAKALVMLGILMPEFRAAHRWQRRGLDVLEREAARQVCSDGVHVERVPHYHHLIAGELLEFLVLLENNDLQAPPALVNSFRQMLKFERHITRPDGHLPLFGDSAHGDLHVRFTPVSGGAALLNEPEFKLPNAVLNEMTIWLLGPKRVIGFYNLPVQPPAPSHCFPEGGYAVMRDSWESGGLYLALDCGPFGYRLSPGHGHADALSLELCAHGQPQLVDAGVYSFHLGDGWRNLFRGTRAHNTVVVDGQDQSLLLDNWRVWRPAQVTLNDWAIGHGFDFVDASHDGYSRLPGRIIHRRRVFFAKPDYWLIVDLLEGKGEHRFEALFHLPPDATVELVPETGVMTTNGMAIVPLNSPGLEVTLTNGWVSGHSGEKDQAPVVVHSLNAPTPATFRNLLCPVDPGSGALPSVVDLSVDVSEPSAEANPWVTALAVDLGHCRDVFILDGRAGLNRKRVGSYETDARLVFLRWRSDELLPERIVLHRGTFLAAGGKTLIRSSHPTVAWELSGKAIG